MAESDVMLEMDRRPISEAKTDNVPQHLADAIRDIPADKIDFVGLDQLTPAKRQIVLDKKSVLEASGVKVVGFRERHIKGRSSYLGHVFGRGCKRKCNGWAALCISR